MNLKSIALFLQANSLGTRGTDIFEGEMPAGCTQGILLLDPYHGSPINHYLPGYIATEFRLIVRSTEREAGLALARQASDLLTIKSERQIDAVMLVKQLLPINEPRPYRRSVGGFWEFEVDFTANYVNT